MSIIKILTIFLIIILAAVATVYVMRMFPQTKPAADKIVTMATEAKDKLVSFVSSPGGAIASVGGLAGVVTLGGAVYSKLQSAKTQLSNTTTQLSTQADKVKQLEAQLKQKTDAATQQAKDVQNSLASETSQLKTQLSTVQNQYSSLEAQKASYQNQVEELKAQLHDANVRYEAVKQKVL
jgi:uncharacterized protein HemX